MQLIGLKLIYQVRNMQLEALYSLRLEDLKTVRTIWNVHTVSTMLVMMDVGNLLRAKSAAK